MNILLIITTALVLVALSFWYARLRASDRILAIMTRRGPISILASRAQLIDGPNHIPVVLSLGDSQIAYENADLDATIDMGQIDEVEYGSDLVTGGIADGAILRLRAHGRAFEFVLESAAASLWSSRLPPHRVDERGTVHVVPI